MGFLSFLCVLWAAPVTSESLTLAAAESLALTRHARVLAAQLDVQLGTLLLQEAGRIQNPEAAYSIGNLVLGQGNDQERDLHPTFFEQSIQQVELTKSLDIWWRRAPQLRAARAGLEGRQYLVEDAVREVRHLVRLRFAAVVREEQELLLARDAHKRFSRNVELMQRRFALGDVSRTTLLQVELEGMHVRTDCIKAEGEWSAARRELAETLLEEDASSLPENLDTKGLEQLVPLAEQKRKAGSAAERLVAVRKTRPDLLAMDCATRAADAQAALARREALPAVNAKLSYARSKFQISGDNPHALGAGIEVQLPLFQRQQQALGEALVAKRRAQLERRTREVEVAQALGRSEEEAERAHQVLEQFELGGMLRRAEQILAATELQLTHGSISLLAFLEAERTFLETQANHLRTRFDVFRSAIDLLYELGEEKPF